MKKFLVAILSVIMIISVVPMGVFTVSAHLHVYDNNCDRDCNVCGDERTPEPHKAKVKVEDGYTFENDTEYPFSLDGSVYISTNKSDDSSATATLTAKDSGSIIIEYYISTEEDDRLTIKCNSTTIRIDSGNTYWRTVTIPVVAGDKIYITYSKDSVVSKESGVVKFKAYQYIVALAEDIQPTCNTVVCDVCGGIIEAALGHRYSNKCDIHCDVCYFERTDAHEYDNDCDEICNECGDTRVGSHVYDNDCDGDCNICGNKRTPEPHKVKAEEEGYTFGNDRYSPLSYDEGVYTFTEPWFTDSATATLTATDSGLIIIKYYALLENHDGFTIKHNRKTKVTTFYSFNNDWQTITIPVVAGDKIDITYRKSEYGEGRSVIKFKAHQYILAEDIQPTCKDAVECDVCSKTVKSALGHSYSNNCDIHCDVCDFERTDVAHEYNNDCDAICNECGDTRTVGDHVYDNDCDGDCNICGNKRTPEPHKVKVDSYTFENDKKYPFSLREVIYTSTNKSGNSSAIATLTADVSGSIVIRYYTSTEEDYDELTIKHNSITKVIASGNTSWQTITIPVVVGDKIYITYSKDSYGSKGSDVVKFEAYQHILAEDAKPTCKDAVVCDVCGKTVKAALSHSYSSNCDAYCDVCNVKRTVLTPHKYDDKCDTSCNMCKATRKITHSYKTATTKATLSKNGSIVKKCKVCGKVASNTAIKYAKTFTLSQTDYTYNGKAKTPSVTVKDSVGKTLKKNTDYTVSYAKGRKNVGRYKVTVKMKGKYKGTKSLSFTIKPTNKTSTSLVAGTTTSIGLENHKGISYSSSNKKVAIVSSKGVITAVKAGTATITIKANGVSQKVKVTVRTPTVKISASKKSMYIGKTLKLTAETDPKDAKVIWSVDNTEIAQISSSGTLTALKDGDVTVTAEISHKGKTYKSTYTVKITVEPPHVQVFITPESDYSASYAFFIKNTGDRPLKVISAGSVFSSGESAFIESLYSDYKYYDSVTLKPKGQQTMVACLDRKLLFLGSQRIWLYLHVEYGGERFILKCKTDYFPLQSCYEFIWLKK